jgi:hypothetical protein
MRRERRVVDNCATSPSVWRRTFVKYAMVAAFASASA